MSKKRIVLFSFYGFVAVFLIFEIGAWAGLSLLESKLMKYTELKEFKRRAYTDMDNSHESLYLKPRRRDSVEVIHPYLGYVYKPEDRQDLLIHGEDDLRNFGFGSGKIIYEPHENHIVIGIFGGSVARNFDMNGGSDTIRKRLESSPEFAGKEIIFVPAAAPSYKQPQQVIALNYLLSLGAHFDLIINIDGFNEIALPKLESMNYGTFPFYPRRWASRVGFLQIDPHLRIKAGKVLNSFFRREEWARKGIEHLPGSTMIGTLVWKTYDEFLAWRARRHVIEYQDAQKLYTSRVYATRGPLRTYDSDEEIMQDFVSVWKNSSIAMNAVAQGLGIRYIHALQPNQYVPNSKVFTEDEREIAVFEEHKYRTAVEEGYPALFKEGQALLDTGVEYYDLTDIYKNTPEHVYTDRCCHVNTLGNIVMGNRIADHILRR